MVGFGHVEGLVGDDFGDDWALEERSGFLFGFLGDALLFRGCGIDSGAVHIPEVRALAVEGTGVVDVPESVEDLGIGDDCGVEFNHDSLSGSGVFIGDLLVGGVFDFATDVSGGCGEDSGGHAEVLFGSPKASSGEDGAFSFGGFGFVFGGFQLDGWGDAGVFGGGLDGGIGDEGEGGDSSEGSGDCFHLYPY